MKETDKASFGELSALAAKLERLLLVKRVVDIESSEDGAVLVYLTGREIELLAEATAEVAAKAFMESR
mgnify:CR=1 FL=1